KSSSKRGYGKLNKQRIALTNNSIIEQSTNKAKAPEVYANNTLRSVTGNANPAAWAASNP
ncbi:hypothetical protein RJ641_002191, partial [Dillenia turbinata]